MSAAVLRIIEFYNTCHDGADGKFCSTGGGASGRGSSVPAGFREATDEDRKALRIPPAWTRVIVAEDRKKGVNGCLAVGYDAKGRRQGRYSAKHTAGQAAAKFKRVQAIAAKLPKLDAHLEKNVEKDDTVAALALIRATGMRPGSDKNTQADKQAYGATTLQAQHVTLGDDGSVRFKFTGKDGVSIDITSSDPLVRRAVEGRLKGKAPGDRLFDTDAVKVNKLLDKVIGTKFKVKDLRTVKANVLALDLVGKMPRPTTKKTFISMRKKVAEAVAAQLGNTYSMCLNAYINPTVFAAWEMK